MSYFLFFSFCLSREVSVNNEIVNFTETQSIGLNNFDASSLRSSTWHGVRQDSPSIRKKSFID